MVKYSLLLLLLLLLFTREPEVSPEPFVSRAKFPPTARSEKGVWGRSSCKIQIGQRVSNQGSEVIPFVQRCVAALVQFATQVDHCTC